MGRFRMGSLYRYVQAPDASVPVIDGIPSFHHIVAMPPLPSLQLERGISAPAPTVAIDGTRLGAVLLSSNAHKAGSAENPWHDIIEPDDGFAKYFGDNKTPGRDPGTVRGNRTLLSQFELHTSPLPDQRKKAAPILIFRSARKGFKEFAGVGVITGARRVTQYSKKLGGFFTNYLFDIAILSLTAEDEEVATIWIKDRRDPTKPVDVANAMAPETWLNWVRLGSAAIEGLRRHVARYHLSPKSEQVLAAASANLPVLSEIYNFYENRKARFEALASLACESTIKQTGANYRRGWLTRGTGDGGLDFVGRVDLGEGMAKTKLVLLGQAKCERIDSPTGGVHVARTVARLRRGWIGAYVTTSFFSLAVQKEVYEDQYPVLMINGAKLAEETLKMQLQSGFPSVDAFLRHVDSTYEDQVSPKKPEEILWD